MRDHPHDALHIDVDGVGRAPARRLLAFLGVPFTDLGEATRAAGAGLEFDARQGLVQARQHVIGDVPGLRRVRYRGAVEDEGQAARLRHILHGLRERPWRSISGLVQAPVPGPACSWRRPAGTARPAARAPCAWPHSRSARSADWSLALRLQLLGLGAQAVLPSWSCRRSAPSWPRSTGVQRLSGGANRHRGSPGIQQRRR